jgi:hypothetical protein
MPLKDIRPALRAFLVADAAIEALVKTGSTTRIYPVKMPQGITATSLVYNVISGDTGLHNEGSDGLASVRMQLTAWAQTADAAQDLFLAVKERLHGYAGAMGSGGAAANVQLARIDTWRDLEDTVAKLIGKSADYFIAFDEE